MSSGLPTLPISIAVSAAEKGSGRLTQRNLEIATRALVRDGLVVLEDLVDHAVLDRLNEKMVQDAYELQSRKDSPYNYNKGNIQQDPPLTSDYFEDTIYTNPIVTQVTSTTLGPYPSLRFVSGNTALPPTPDSPPASQPIHADADFDHPSIPFALVINIPLVTMTPENGSTEIWLGTHSATSIADQEADDLKERLTREQTGLDVAATFASEKEVLRGYLNRPYGNAYDFDQFDKIEGIF
ncbi:hypothetical protein E8E12_010351 [Didymella heteroderae]|uniref:Uncharacterized protein n=1 Tax=Didymella heteroderae TaxID=1769908 RepID=A0A9P4WWP6_9PLEO|nr:hypothetical protein E8E12_010351 [Didymella heteroderae]